MKNPGLKLIFGVNKFLVMAAAILLLGGCFQLLPVNVVQRIVVDRSGGITVDYQGKFTDLVEYMMPALSKDERKEGQAELKAYRKNSEASLLQQAKIAGVQSLRKQADGSYEIHWQDQGKMLASTCELTLLLTTIEPVKNNTGDQQDSSQTFAFNDHMVDIEKSFKEMNEEPEDKNDEDEVLARKVLSKYSQEFRGRVEIEINPEFVTQVGGKSPDKDMIVKLKDGQDGRKIFIFERNGISLSNKGSEQFMEFSLGAQQAKKLNSLIAKNPDCKSK